MRGNCVNEIKLEFEAISENEALARVVIAAFMAEIDPTLDELDDVKTAVSEAVTNAIVHGYKEDGGRVTMIASLKDIPGKEKLIEKKLLAIDVCDTGIGIEDVEQAMQPMFTTGVEGERSGMGFSFMEAFMDSVIVTSSPNMGTIVHMERSFDAGSGEKRPLLQAAVLNRSGRT